MRVLLDTNSFLWFIGGNDRLSPDFVKSPDPVIGSSIPSPGPF